jgi:hypothetical protein
MNTARAFREAARRDEALDAKRLQPRPPAGGLLRDRAERPAAQLVLAPGAFPVEDIDPEHDTDASIIERQAPARRALRRLVLGHGYHPIAYRTENDGELWRVVRPTLEEAHKPSSKGRVAFDAHSDNTNRPMEDEASDDARAPPPDVLALGCLVNEGEVATCFISPPVLLRKLSPRHRLALAQPDFIFRAPASDAGASHRGRVLVRDGLRFDANEDDGIPRTEGVTNGARRALLALRDAIRDTAPYHVVLRPGDACMWNNHALLHLRGQIHGRRCLLRVYGLRDVLPHWRVSGNVLR